MPAESPTPSELLLALDVYYAAQTATVAGLTFARWEDAQPIRILKSALSTPSDYLPGEFYRRELPCLLSLIESFQLQPQVIVIDGFVYLDGRTQPGLGKHLFDALAERAAVVGVAKSPFHGIAAECELLRGRSRRPLFVTSVGISLDEAKSHIAHMHGHHRIPTLLKQVDAVTRTA